MRKMFLISLLILSACATYAQTFTDNFNRANNTAVGNGWTELETVASGAQIVSNRLQLGSTTAGREFVSRDVSALYTTDGITANTGLIVWAFNFRNSRTDPSGFAGGGYGIAFVLGKTTNTITDGNGYAVIIGQSGGTDEIRLASFANGLGGNANFTSFISGGDYGNEYISVKVIYNPATDEWSLFAESNASNFPRTDPTLTSAQIGATTVNTVHTAAGNNLKYTGAFWNHATAAADNAIFDDVSISVLPLTYYPKTTATDLTILSDWTTNSTGGAGAAPPNFTSPNQLFNLNGLVDQKFNSPWILSGGSNAIITAGGLKIGPSATLQVGAGSTFNFNGRPVNISSFPTATGSIGVTLGTITNATNVTVERYISSANNRAYRLLAPSVNTAGSIRANWQENGNNGGGVGTHITGSTTGANGFDATQTGEPSLFGFDPVTFAYVPVPNTNVTTLDAKKGYLLYVRGDRTIDLSSAASPLPTTNTVLRTTGTLLTGEQTFSNLPGNEEFSLVTNPYPAAINWASVRAASTNLKQYYTLWDPNVNQPNGGYVTIGADGSSSHPVASSANIHIQTGQAFFVQATAGSASSQVKILETHKSAVNGRDVFRTGTHTEIFAAGLFYTDQSGSRINADGVAGYFSNTYSPTVDENDASQIPNWNEDVAIGRNNHELSIETRPLIDARDTIPFMLSRLKVQAYEWEFNAADFSHPDLNATLVDKFLNTRTTISLSGSTVIPFTVTSDPASAAADRFMVVFGPNNVLPVNMSNVKAYQKGKDIQVEWTVQMEINMERYEIEKSIDGQQFNKAFATAASGSNSVLTYSWLDGNAHTGSNYYRIKAIGKSGEVQYSKVVRVNMGKGVHEVIVYPNPLTDNAISLSINLPKGKYTVTLTNGLGQHVYQKQMVHAGGAATETLQFGISLAQGMYQLRVSDGENSYVQQLIKN